MPLPSPDTCLTYASILRKERRDKDGLSPPGEIALAAAEALEYAARNVNADSAIAGQLAQTMQENGKLRVALAAIRDTALGPAEMQKIATDALTPKHHDFAAVGITTDKPGGGM